MIYIFTRGYTKELAQKIRKGAKFIARCESCKHYDEGGNCTNCNVTEFDLVKDGERQFCLLWSPEDDTDRK